MSKFISLRGSTGVRMARETSGPSAAVPTWQEESGTDASFSPDSTKNCKVMCFDPSGDVFAWSDGDCVRVVRLDAANDRWTPVCRLDHARVSQMGFSPLGRVLATWDVLSTKKGEAAPHNLRLWDPSTGAAVGSFSQKRSFAWCPQWSRDERVSCVRSPNNEAFFYADNDFSSASSRLSLPRMESFSLSPGDPSGSSCHVACFVPGQKGGPGFCKLYAHPNFHPEKDVVASKSFFQADKMEVEWSADGRMALLTTQADVDKTGGSYYGKQQLHFANASNGDTAMVQLAKEGPIYSTAWSPAAPEFCVVYGYMPAKATLYSSKCEKVFDFGTGSRNEAIYNPQGNLLLLGGFGNLRGTIEVWAVKDRKRVSDFEADNSTDIRWNPADGQRILTSTCAPRLRQDNGYKVWHYTGALLHERFEDPKEELWQAQWQERPAKAAAPFQIQYRKVEGIAPKQPQASKVAYRPPGMRAKPGATFKLHDEDELPENQKKKDGEALSKSQAKNKKRREAAKKKKDEGGDQQPQQQQQEQQPQQQQQGPLTDKEKELRKLNQKLQQIQKLKQQQKDGKTLEINQLDKIKTEADVLAQIEQHKL